MKLYAVVWYWGGKHHVSKPYVALADAKQDKHFAKGYSAKIVTWTVGDYLTFEQHEGGWE